MMNQLSLLPDRPDLEAAYRVWVGEHPEVFALFERFALERLRQGRRFGIGALAERVRWEVATTWDADVDGYKINNNHMSFLARDLIKKYPAMNALLETRKLRSE